MPLNMGHWIEMLKAEQRVAAFQVCLSEAAARRRI